MNNRNSDKVTERTAWEHSNSLLTIFGRQKAPNYRKMHKKMPEAYRKWSAICFISLILTWISFQRSAMRIVKGPTRKFLPCRNVSRENGIKVCWATTA
jgi:hypothetical protein